MKDKAGYVYLVKSDTGHWKIGHTAHLHDRRRAFGVKLPVEIEFTHLITCYNRYKLENELHFVFEDKRIKGSEWFDLDDVEVNWIKAIESQVHFDMLLTVPNPYVYHASLLVEGEKIHKLERSLVFKGALCLLLMFTLLVGVVAIKGVFMTSYVALPIIFASFALLVTIGGDVVDIYTRMIRNIDKQARVKQS